MDQTMLKKIHSLKTGEEAIAFFANYSNTTPIKFIYCVIDNKPNCFRPYDLKVIEDQNMTQKFYDEYFCITAQGII